MAGKQREAILHLLLLAELRIGAVERRKRIERRLVPFASGRNRRLPVIVHRAHAMRIKLHHGVDDLPGARIHVALPHRPPASRTVVHWIVG